MDNNTVAIPARICLVVIPTYNERENLVKLVTEVLNQGAEYDVLVVDDNSPDGTGDIADQLVAHWEGRVHVMHRLGKQGLGSAYLAGFNYGLAYNYQYIFEMDADFSHRPEYLPALLEAARQNGIAVGSRLIKGGHAEGWPWYRHLISRGGSLYSRLILNMKVKDCTSGYKCFASRVLRELQLSNRVRSSGFGFQVEVNYLCERNGYRVTEVPIIFPDRQLGKSKMNKKIFLEALLMVWKLRFSSIEQPERATANLMMTSELESEILPQPSKV